MHDSSSPPGLLDSVHALAATAVRGMHTRLQLAAVELESERDHLLARLALLLLSLRCAAFGFVLGVLWLVMSVDEAHRVAVLGVVALVFLAASVAAALAVRATARNGFMPATLRVLADDAQALGAGRGAPPRPGRTAPGGTLDA
jgi:uncharacterized membrane protein YqjE